MPPSDPPGTLDALGRPLRDLRISVTDRCNFRCVYCMPRELFGPDFPFLPRAEMLSFEEIVRLSRAFAALGVSKLRLTGGEPLVRPQLERLVAMLRRIAGVRELTLTTNGSLLARKAAALRRAGLDRLTVSLDALDDPTFRRVNDTPIPVARVLDGIAAAEAAGFTRLKVNMVVRRGLNEHSVLPMARYFRDRGHVLRFIEYMDVGASNGWQPQDVVPASEIVERIDAELPLLRLEPQYRGEVAERWAYRDGSGEIGVIASVSQPFCADCSRARLTADGVLYTCLFATSGHALAPLVRGAPGARRRGDRELARAIAGLWRARDDRYSELRFTERSRLPRVEMSRLGG